jgi:hypothetical protein
VGLERVECPVTPSDEDCTPQLLEFIASLPNGREVHFRPGAYRVDGTIRLVDRVGLTFDGHGALFFTDLATPPAYATTPAVLGQTVEYPWRLRSHWSIEGGSGITLRNLAIRGPNAAGGTGEAGYVEALEAQHGVNINGATNVLIENVDISFVYGDFIYVGATYRNINPTGASKYVFNPSRNVTIRGGVWRSNGRQGVGVASVDGLLIDGISMTDTRRASIDLEPNGATDVIRDVTIRDSYFGPGRLLWIASKGGPGVFENLLIENNRLDRGAQVYINAPATARRKNIRFLNNVATVPNGGGNQGLWSIWRVDGFEARGNIAPLDAFRTHPGLWAYDVTGLTAEPGQWLGGKGPQVYESPTP